MIYHFVDAFDVAIQFLLTYTEYENYMSFMAIKHCIQVIICQLAVSLYMSER